MFCWGIAIRLPATMVTAASAGRHRHPQQHRVPDAFQVEAEDHDEARGLRRHREPGHERRARRLVGVGHPHVERERGDLEAEPGQAPGACRAASAGGRRQAHRGWPRCRVVARRRRRRTTGRTTSTADDTVPTRKNLSAASTATGSRLGKPVEHVERDRHQLEGDEEQDQVARRGQHEHAEQRREHGHVVLGARRAKAGWRRASEREHADEGRARNSRLAKSARSSWTKRPSRERRPGSTARRAKEDEAPSRTASPAMRRPPMARRRGSPAEHREPIRTARKSASSRPAARGRAALTANTPAASGAARWRCPPARWRCPA